MHCRDGTLRSQSCSRYNRCRHSIISRVTVILDRSLRQTDLTSRRRLFLQGAATANRLCLPNLCSFTMLSLSTQTLTCVCRVATLPIRMSMRTIRAWSWRCGLRPCRIELFTSYTTLWTRQLACSAGGRWIPWWTPMSLITTTRRRRPALTPMTETTWCQA